MISQFRELLVMYKSQGRISHGIMMEMADVNAFINLIRRTLFPWLVLYRGYSLRWQKKTLFIFSSSTFRKPFKTFPCIRTTVSLCREPFIEITDRASFPRMKITSTNGRTVKGSAAAALLSNRHKDTHTRTYRHTFNREHRSSSWASTWLSYTLMRRESSCFF